MTWVVKFKDELAGYSDGYGNRTEMNKAVRFKTRKEALAHAGSCHDKCAAHLARITTKKAPDEYAIRHDELMRCRIVLQQKLAGEVSDQALKKIDDVLFEVKKR